MAVLRLRHAAYAVLLLRRLRLEDQFAFLGLHCHAAVVRDFAGDELVVDELEAPMPSDLNACDFELPIRQGRRIVEGVSETGCSQSTSVGTNFMLVACRCGGGAGSASGTLGAAIRGRVGRANSGSPTRNRSIK